MLFILPLGEEKRGIPSGIFHRWIFNTLEFSELCYNSFSIFLWMSKPLRDYCFKRLSKREYGVFELRQKLLQKFPDQINDIEETLKYLQDHGWLSDERFCEAFIRHQMLTTKSGPKKIFLKLKQKGIDPDMAQEKIESVFPEDSQKELLLSLLKKKNKDLQNRKKNLSAYERRNKVFQFLLGKGYDYDCIKKIEPDIW